MAKNHFALERPRRINISIPGYDAKALTRQQQERLARQRRGREDKKKSRRDDAAARSVRSQPTPAAEVQQLQAALAAPVEPAGGDNPLMAVLLDGGGEGGQA